MLPNYEIARLDPFDKRWIDFVEAFPQANIFHHPNWIDILSECYGYQSFVIALINEQSRICAGLPFLDVDSLLTGRRWVSLPFTDYCLPLYSDQDAYVNFSDELIKLAAGTSLEVRWELPTNPLIQQNSQHVWHTLNLDRKLDAIYGAIHRTQRQNIKTAEKNGIQIEWGKNLNSLHEFYRLHCLTRRRQGVPVQPWRFFELIFTRLIDPGMGFILLAYHQDQCLAAGLFLNWQKSLIYKFAASSDSGQDLRPNHLINWTAIRWGCDHGYQRFDFGRTDCANEGLRTFKIRWGADETPLIYSHVQEKTTHSTNNGKSASLMNTIIKRSPTWVCRLAGEVLYRHFG